MDDILEKQIAFKEELLRTYMRMSQTSKRKGHTHELTIDEMLDDLSKLYKKRKK